MMLPSFIALTDKDKRVILIFFLLLIVLVAFVAVIGAIITRVMRWQGKKLDDLTHDVVKTKVIDNRKDFLRYARIKNWRYYFRQAWIPLIILIVSVMILVIHNAATNNWDYDLLDYNKTGFNTLFFIWDFNDPAIHHKFFGIDLICDWPKVINTPHFSIDAWASYLFFFGTLVGGAWYLVVLQCLIARTIRMYKLSYDIYNKSLDGYNAHKDEDNNN